MLDILAITGPIYLVVLAGYLATRFGLFARADMRAHCLQDIAAYTASR